MFKVVVYPCDMSAPAHESEDHETFRDAKATLTGIIAQGPDGDRLVKVLEMDKCVDYSIWSAAGDHVGDAMIKEVP